MECVKDEEREDITQINHNINQTLRVLSHAPQFSVTRENTNTMFRLMCYISTAPFGQRHK